MFSTVSRTICTVLGVLATVGMLTALIMGTYVVGRDIGSWKERAQVATSAEDMVMYIGNLRQGIERWGFTEGHCAVIFKTPANDMRLAYRAVLEAEKQAEIIAKIPRHTDAYQQGTDNLRGTLRELEVPDADCWAVRNWVFAYGGWILVCLLWIPPIVYAFSEI